MQRSESFENPSAGRGAMSFGSYSQDDEKSSGTPKFGKALYDFTAGGDDEVMYDKYSGRSHRFAFVTMNSVDDATAAIGKLNDTEIGGRKIKVNITEKPLQSLDLPIPPSEDSEFVDSPYKVSVGNLAKTVTSEILTWFFSEKGKVLGAKVFRVPGTSKTSGFGFIAFSSDEEVEAATAEFNNAKLNNMLLCQASSEPFLCVKQNLGNQTELRHAPNIASAVPPCSLLSASEDLMPFQGDVVKTLTSVLATMLCPSALSSKLRLQCFCTVLKIVKYF